MAILDDSRRRALLAYVDAGHGAALVSASDWVCCYGAIHGGLVGCTCWEPVYDLVQTDPSADAVAALALGDTEPAVRDRICGGCAYRPGSPEMTGDTRYQGDPETLDEWARGGHRFWCHEGFRRPVGWKHPSGVRIPALAEGDYQPPVVDGIPYQADGSPGLLCAGWNARRRALTHSREGQQS